MFGFLLAVTGDGYSYAELESYVKNLRKDGAYYWVYARYPDWSYFDHPPLVAYTIAFFTMVLGDQAWAIRLGALLYGTGTAWLAYFIGRDVFSPRVGFPATAW